MSELGFRMFSQWIGTGWFSIVMQFGRGLVFVCAFWARMSLRFGDLVGLKQMLSASTDEVGDGIEVLGSSGLGVVITGIGKPGCPWNFLFIGGGTSSPRGCCWLEYSWSLMWKDGLGGENGLIMLAGTSLVSASGLVRLSGELSID